MKTRHLIFPHQLFRELPLRNTEVVIYLIEELLFFNLYKFHKQKLVFHRASMKAYQQYLESNGFEVFYIQAIEENSDIRVLLSEFTDEGIKKISFIDPVDCWLEQRIEKACSLGQMESLKIDSPMFLNTAKDLHSFFRPDKKKYFQTSFYKDQRKLRNILISKDQKPEGGKWTYDMENRKKYPPNKQAPPLYFPEINTFYKEAKAYVEDNYQNNPGLLDEMPLYPINFKATDQWLEQFLEYRFADFGTYEDAIVKHESWLHHSVMTPMLNTGLIGPHELVSRVLSYARENQIPINSTEGFIRQVIGWREFIRGIYISRGTDQRTRNYWGFNRKIPASFYSGTTGIDPIDETIKKVIKTGYCHHIERLMVLGNFMMLCEFDPDEVYRWFMELFIDAYDWVMVPNVYGMSQFSDGGLMASKPYISGSNYLMKMSNFKKGSWNDTWDGLFWRFMDVHRNFFKKNPRLGMLINTYDKMSSDKQGLHHNNANTFLDSLDI